MLISKDEGSNLLLLRNLSSLRIASALIMSTPASIRLYIPKPILTVVGIVQLDKLDLSTFACFNSKDLV